MNKAHTVHVRDDASRRIVSGLEKSIGRTVEVIAAALVVVEIVVLLAGVLSRYLLHAPLVWSDELASILFLWLAMLGSVIALRRGEHMRMTAVVGCVKSPSVKAFLDFLAVAAPLLFLGLVLSPAIEFAQNEAIVTTPALGISSAWRASALPVGMALLLVIALFRLVNGGNLKLAALAVAIVAAIAFGLVGIQPWLQTLGNLNLLVFFVVIVAVAVLSGVPIAFAFGLATFGYLALTTDTPMEVLVGRMDEGMSHLILLAVPLFVFLGQLIEMTGMAKAMIACLASLVGHMRGGLHYVLIGAMYLVSGISGSKAADMAAVAPALLPEMKARGAKQGDLLALLAATGAQTETIPPSLVLITLGSVTGVSIAALFTGGMLPGVILAAILSAVVWRRYRHVDLAGVERADRKQVLRSFVVALPALALPFVIRAAVVEGVATATEVSTIGIVYTALAGLFIYRKFSWSRLLPMLIESASLSGAVLLIIGAASGMAWALTQSGFSSQLATAITSLPGGTPMFMFASIVAFIVLGSVLEGIPAIVLFGPLMFPIARQLGVNEVHYAMVVILSMGVGLFAPPFGVGYYSACAVSRIAPDEGMKPILGYLAALVVGLAVVAAVPWISIGFIH